MAVLLVAACVNPADDSGDAKGAGDDVGAVVADWWPVWQPDACDERSVLGLTGDAPFPPPFDRSLEGIRLVLEQALDRPVVQTGPQEGQVARWNAGRDEVRLIMADGEPYLDGWIFGDWPNGTSAEHKAGFGSFLHRLVPEMAWTIQGSTEGVSNFLQANGVGGKGGAWGRLDYRAYSNERYPAHFYFWLELSPAAVPLAATAPEYEGWALDVVRCRQSTGAVQAGALEAEAKTTVFGQPFGTSAVLVNVRLPVAGHHCGGPLYNLWLDAQSGALAASGTQVCI